MKIILGIMIVCLCVCLWIDGYVTGISKGVSRCQEMVGRFDMTRQEYVTFMDFRKHF